MHAFLYIGAHQSVLLQTRSWFEVILNLILKVTANQKLACSHHCGFMHVCDCLDSLPFTQLSSYKSKDSKIKINHIMDRHMHRSLVYNLSLGFTHHLSTLSIFPAQCNSCFSTDGALRWAEGSVSCHYLNGCASISKNSVSGAGDTDRTFFLTSFEVKFILFWR